MTGSPGPPSVAIVVTDTRRGGAPLRFAALARGVRQRGWDVRFASVLPAGPVLADLAAQGIATLSLDVRSAADVPLAVLRLRTMLRRQRPHVLQTSLWHANLLGRVATAGTGIPVVNGHESLNDDRPIWQVAIDRLTHPLAAQHCAVSQAVATRIHARDHVPLSRVQVIPSGLDVDRWQRNGRRLEARRAWGIPAEALVAGWVGRLEPVKNVAALVDAIALLPEWWLVLTGSGPQEAQIRRRVEELGVGGRVVLTGELLDVHGVHEALDVLCVASLWEGLCLALMEGMAAGLPVVATAVGGIPELVTPECDGLLVPAGDPKAMAEALQRALKEPELGIRARETIRTRFSEEAMVDRFEQLWREVAAASGRRVSM